MGAGSHSKGGLRTVPLRRAGGGGGGHEGATPRGAGSRRERGQRDPCQSCLDGDHAATLTTLLPCPLLSADFPVPPCRWYDPPVSERGSRPVLGLSSSRQRVPRACGSRFQSRVGGNGGGWRAPLLKSRSPRRAHRGAGWRGSCKDTRGRAGEIGAEPARLGQQEPSQGVEERENRGGGGAARAAETLGVTQASGTPRPLRPALEESREPARRRRTVGVGVGTPVLGGGASRSPEASERQT